MPSVEKKSKKKKTNIFLSSKLPLSSKNIKRYSTIILVFHILYFFTLKIIFKYYPIHGLGFRLRVQTYPECRSH